MKRIYSSPNFTTYEGQDVIVMSGNVETDTTGANLGGNDWGVADDGKF